MCNSAWKSPCSVCAVKPEHSSCTAVFTNCIFQMLHTDKADKKNHGKGISIVKSIAEKYGGDVVISEKNNEFIVLVILDNRIFT